MKSAWTEKSRIWWNDEDPPLSIMEINQRISDWSDERCAEIEYFTISSNELCDVPQKISRLTNLGCLSLSRNRVSVLPSWIGNLIKLQKLYINYNEFRTLPVTLGRLTDLKWIALYENDHYAMTKVAPTHYGHETTQRFLKPFRCALCCQAVVVAILGTFRRWKIVRLHHDMARMLAEHIWRMRENPVWSE